MTIKMIIATDCNFGIGKDNKLPWDCPEDLRYFKEKTKLSAVVMGKSTWESLPMFPSGLPSRENYVLSSCIKEQVVYDTDNEILESLEFHSSPKNILLALEDNSYYGHIGNIWIIGGASTYSELLPYVEEIHHTTIDGDYDCDTFFDMSFLKDWKLVGGKNLSDKAEVNIWRKS